MDRMLKTGYNFIKMSQRILSTIIAVSICLSCFAVDLSAQAKKDDKKWEITGYFGAGRAGNIGGYYPEGGRFSPFQVPCYGLGMEYSLTPRISFEGEINYLPNSSRMVKYTPHPELIYIWDEGLLEYTIIVGKNYRLFGAINFLFYLTTLNNENIATVFLTVGASFIFYDHAEYTIVIPSISKRYENEKGKLFILPLIDTFGVGLKVRIKEHWALRVLYKINGFGREELENFRLALGLSYRF